MNLGKNSQHNESIFAKKLATSKLTSRDRPASNNKTLENVYSAANVNPFSPNSKWFCVYTIKYLFLFCVCPFLGLLMQNKKRSRTAAAQEYTKTTNRNKEISNDLNRNTLAQNRNNKTSEETRRSVASLFSNYVDSNSDEDFSDMVQAPKRLALQDSNISRYEKEFLQISQIGTPWYCPNSIG